LLARVSARPRGGDGPEGAPWRELGRAMALPGVPGLGSPVRLLDDGWDVVLFLKACICKLLAACA
jgi:hypothetical protein